MNLTVFGATGGIGREVVPQALDAGHHVTAYVRSPAKLTVTHPNLSVITGELTDHDAVQRAIRGADAVISGLGPSLDRKATGMPLVEGTHTIIEAMRAEGVERYIGMATPSLRDPRDTGSLLGRLVPFICLIPNWWRVAGWRQGS
jgi:putative NADH-flavin reductase